MLVPRAGWANRRALGDVLTLDLGRLITRSLRVCWRNPWLAVLGAPTGGGGASGFIIGEVVLEVALFLSILVGAALSGTAIGTVAAVGVAALVGTMVVVAVLYVAAAATAAVLWAGIELDSANPVRGRQAWHQGRRRARRFMGILLLQAATYVVPLLLLLIPFVAMVSALGPRPSGSAILVVLGGMAIAELAVFVVIMSCQLIFGWAPALAMVRELGALASYRESWRLVRRHKLDSFLLFLVAVFSMQFLSVFVFFAAVVAAIPGLAILVIGAATRAVVVTGLGVALATLGACAGLLLVGGFLGAVQQVMYALGCRDLTLADASAQPSPPARRSSIEHGLPPASVLA